MIFSFRPQLTGRFDTIVVDPPWPFEIWSERGNKKSASRHYETMPFQRIAALPIESIAERHCLLLLWTAGNTMATGVASDIVRFWGFKPKSELVWRKLTKNGKPRLGTGYRVRSLHESILLATLGSPVHDPFPSLFDGVAREHSRKPTEFYDLVRVITYGHRRADLFSREEHKGFHSWGDERGKFQVSRETGKAA